MNLPGMTKGSSSLRKLSNCGRWWHGIVSWCKNNCCWRRCWWRSMLSQRDFQCRRSRQKGFWGRQRKVVLIHSLVFRRRRERKGMLIHILVGSLNLCR